VVILDRSDHLRTILLGKVKVKKDEIRACSACMLPLPAQQGQGICAVFDDCELVGQRGLFEGFERQTDIPWIVFDEEYLHWSVGLVPLQAPSPCVCIIR